MLVQGSGRCVAHAMNAGVHRHASQPPDLIVAHHNVWLFAEGEVRGGARRVRELLWRLSKSRFVARELWFGGLLLDEKVNILIYLG